MTGAAPPPRLPPFPEEVVPPRPAPPVQGAPRPVATPWRRFLAGLAVSLPLGAASTVLLVGMPGLVPLFVANAALTVLTGHDRLTALRESAWGATLLVTALWPVPFAPALAGFTKLRPRAPAFVAWLLAFAVTSLWAVAVAFAVLLAS